MNNNGYTINCPKCGEEMKSDARYCMKCGYINTDHEANKNMKKYVKNVSTTYQVGSGGIIAEDTSTSKSSISLATNTGNRKIAFFITYAIYLVLAALGLHTAVSNGVNNLETLALSTFPLTILTISILFLYIYSLELVFMKCNKPWWAGLIPVYNLIVLGEITFHKKYIGLLIFIPVIGQIFILVMLYKLGRQFNYNGFLVILFSFIFLPLMAYGSHTYEGITYVDSEEKSQEKDYKLKKIFLSTIVLFIIIAVSLDIMANISSVKKTKQLFGNSYYVLANKRMISKVKYAIDNNRINCQNGMYNENTGVYYFYFSDLGEDVYLPLYMAREPIEGYVKVDNNEANIGVKYYSSLTDGTYGFPETIEESVNIKTVVEYPTLNYNNNNITCKIGY